mmetsp:Transcript_61474/g.136952  ORF Transcript_61474/g.136952 Transcript_61474/m.136952 type:complete len:249 (-) Transcript_61474:647-1393(-)
MYSFWMAVLSCRVERTQMTSVAKRVAAGMSSARTPSYAEKMPKMTSCEVMKIICSWTDLTCSLKGLPMSSSSRSAPCVLHVSETTIQSSSISERALTHPPPRSKITILATLDMRFFWMDPFGRSRETCSMRPHFSSAQPKSAARKRASLRWPVASVCWMYSRPLGSAREVLSIPRLRALSLAPSETMVPPVSSAPSSLVRFALCIASNARWSPAARPLRSSVHMSTCCVGRVYVDPARKSLRKTFLKA